MHLCNTRPFMVALNVLFDLECHNPRFLCRSSACVRVCVRACLCVCICSAIWQRSSEASQFTFCATLGVNNLGLHTGWNDG